MKDEAEAQRRSTNNYSLPKETHLMVNEVKDLNFNNL